MCIRDSKKLTFQLTPLLDLLLIVIFAQFMEVEQTTAKSEQTMSSRLAAVEQREADFEQRRQKMENELRTAAREALKREIDRREQRYQELVASLNEQQEQTGQILGEFFNVPEETVNRLLRINPAQRVQPKQAAQLRRDLRSLQNVCLLYTSPSPRD